MRRPKQERSLEDRLLEVQRQVLILGAAANTKEPHRDLGGALQCIASGVCDDISEIIGSFGAGV